ncbi:MAG: glycosyltransferase family 2 protein [Phycisphaerae bacterium]|nr:glycosyltransferase family 2 protein [Phycisphaerae bacterium]
MEPVNDAAWQLPAFKMHELAERRTRYCVCVPVLNEGQRIRRQLAAMQANSSVADIIICDGNSSDGALEHDFLRESHVRTLLVKTGPGKLGAQLRMGYAYALRQGYEGIITVDGNGKDGVEAIPSFVAALDDGHDLVQGSRFVPGGEAVNTPLMRWLAIKLIHAPGISWAAGFHYTDTTNGFRAYSRRLLLDLRVQPFRDVFGEYELLAYMSVRAPQLGFKTKEIPVARRYPDRGETPTKISHFRGNITLLKTLLRVARHRYDPPGF